MMTFPYSDLFISRNQNNSKMKTLGTMLKSYFSKFKTRDLIMSGILVAVIIAYGWDEDDANAFPMSPYPQQQYAPAPQAPEQPQPYSEVTSGRQPVQFQQPQGATQQMAQPHPYSEYGSSGQPAQAIPNQHEKFHQVEPRYQQGGYPTSQVPNAYSGRPMQTQRSPY